VRAKERQTHRRVETSTIRREASGFISLAEPLIAASLRREMNAAFRDLRTLLEASAPADSHEATAH
jgi:hypothetical protein